jgi:hypothetical protein
MEDGALREDVGGVCRGSVAMLINGALGSDMLDTLLACSVNNRTTVQKNWQMGELHKLRRLAESGLLECTP